MDTQAIIQSASFGQGLHWQLGWWMVLAGFISGALLGLFFHRDDFLGGYGSFSRRIARLGHIALVALGLINFFYSAVPASEWARGGMGGTAMVVGALSMPLLCFLSAWKPFFRHLFFIPVICLATAATTGALS